MVSENKKAAKLYFIIEEAQFNLGDFNKALQMIEMASYTGADAIEFQLAYADDFYIQSESGHGIYKTREFSDDQLRALVKKAHDSGLQFIATCLSYKLVKKMSEFGAHGFNINASDINNPSIIDEVIKTQKPFFVSMPLATNEEIEWVYQRIVRQNKNAEFTFLQGQHPMASGHEYVSIEDTALGFIKTIEDKYNKPVGFIDHTSETWMPAIAVAAGAVVITKHMTLSHLFKGPDFSICLDPEEMKAAIAQARKVFQSKLVNSKELAKGEDLDRSVMRRSIVTTAPIKKGSVVSMNQIEFKRPGTGIPPHQVETILGKTAATDIPADVLLTNDMFI